MSQSRTPAYLVAGILCALMVLPVVILMMVRGGDGDSADVGGADDGGAPAVASDFDLRKLAERADGLLENEIAAALRKGDVSLDFVAGLNRTMEQAREAMARGGTGRARELYGEVVRTAEARLEALTIADKARELSESSYTELNRLEYLESTFENTYAEAVETYNAALRDLNADRYRESVDGFEIVNAILGDLEARAVQRVGGLLDAGGAALRDYDLSAARSAYRSVLEIEAQNSDAKEGLAKVEALEGIADEVRAIQALEESGDYEAALEELDALSARHPDNSFLESQRSAIEAKIREREFEEAVARADAAESEGDLPAAIEALEAALALKETSELKERLAKLEAQQKAVRLETLLSEGYGALEAGRYADARDAYKEAVALAPDSREARNGYEKASSLYLANIRYTQNLANARKYIKEGRFPLASRFFNEAMAARPSTVSPSRAAEEASIRKALEAQSEKVSVIIESDNRTFVSIIGVLPPGKLRSEELKLYPDVYTVKGQRSGYKDVEIEFKVDATEPAPTVRVVADERL
ncbi:MAG: hypothetical protein ACLFVC_07120 [Opitutales bacterium]